MAIWLFRMMMMTMCREGGRLNTERSWTHNEGSFTVTGISNILTMMTILMIMMMMAMMMMITILITMMMTTMMMTMMMMILFTICSTMLWMGLVLESALQQILHHDIKMAMQLKLQWNENWWKLSFQSCHGGNAICTSCDESWLLVDFWLLPFQFQLRTLPPPSTIPSSLYFVFFAFMFIPEVSHFLFSHFQFPISHFPHFLSLLIFSFSYCSVSRCLDLPFPPSAAARFSHFLVSHFPISHFSVSYFSFSYSSVPRFLIVSVCPFLLPLLADVDSAQMWNEEIRTRQEIKNQNRRHFKRQKTFQKKLETMETWLSCKMSTILGIDVTLSIIIIIIITIIIIIIIISSQDLGHFLLCSLFYILTLHSISLWYSFYPLCFTVFQ